MEKKLTNLEATMLIAGSGIGTGILAIPYAASRIGLYGVLIAVIFAFILSLILYFVLAELVIHSNNSKELLGILKEHLFVNKNQKIISNILFIILTVLLLESLIVYILTAADIMNDIFGLNVMFGKIIFYLVASIVIMYGIKIIGISEKYSMILISSVILFLSILSLFNVENQIDISFGSSSIILAVYGLFMFAFSSVFAVIQVANNLEHRDKIKRVLVSGLTINATLTVLFAFMVMVASDEVTSVATIGLANSLGYPFIKIICALFVLLGMFTSYWVNGKAFGDMVKEKFNIKSDKGWLIESLPPVVIAVIFPLTLLSYIQIGAGFFAIIVILLILPAYHNAIKKSNQMLLLGKFGKTKLLLLLILIFNILVTISSFIPIDR